jgi:NAD(P)-dependent dehydrogenase (short-subunit alcohol dehydrogenase family)
VGGLFGSDELWDKVIAVNLSGTFFCTRAEASAMKARGGGVIVNVSSTNGLMSSSEMPFYDAAKHGVIGLIKSAALELAKSNIRVNALCPGFTVTPMTLAVFGEDAEAIGAAATPLGRGCQPEEQAGVIAWLCSNDASLMTGSIVVVDGGLAAGRVS